MGDTTFHHAKAPQIREIELATDRLHGGELPCEAELVRSFRGVGPKCAHLALGIACPEHRISVDIHVHRVTNCWDYVSAPTPERTMAEWERRLLARYRVELKCPVLDICRQVGVEAHR